MSFLAFFIVFAGSVLYLIKRDSRWDGMALAAGEVGVMFVSIALITGVIWAKPVWNVWWTWEPRLTTTLVLWLIYVGYLMVRAYAPNQAKAAVYSAVVGIIGFVDVPIVYYSVQWWRSIHPAAGGGAAGGQRFAGPHDVADSAGVADCLPVLLCLAGAGADGGARRRGRTGPRPVRAAASGPLRRSSIGNVHPDPLPFGEETMIEET